MKDVCDEMNMRNKQWKCGCRPPRLRKPKISPFSEACRDVDGEQKAKKVLKEKADLDKLMLDNGK